MRSALAPPIHKDIDLIAHGVHDLRQLIEWCSRAIQLTAAMVRQNNARAADLSCTLRIRYRHNSLQTKFAVPMSYHLSHIVPIHRRVKHLGEIPADRHRPAAHVHVLVQLRQLKAFMSNVVECPYRSDRELEHPSERQPEGNREPGA